MITTIGKAIVNGVTMTTKTFAISAGITTGVIIGAIVLDWNSMRKENKTLREAIKNQMNEQNDN